MITMDYFIIYLVISLIIIGCSGIGIGIIFYYYLKRKQKKKKCPKCNSSNVYLLKMMKFCAICNKNVGVYKCNECKYDFLECGHKSLDMNMKT